MPMTFFGGGGFSGGGGGGARTIPLTGAMLTREINGVTRVGKALFPPGTVFTAGSTLINDTDGTLGVYTGDADTATVNIETKTVSAVGADEPTLLGNVAARAGLPPDQAAALALFGRNASLDDYARVIADETNNGYTVEYYISAVDGSGNIAWGNPVVINTHDYQAQTAASDSGKVLTGGAAPGTFGASKSIDTAVTLGSANLITSEAVARAQFYAYLPDYAKMESINRITQNNGTWTADRDGFVKTDSRSQDGLEHAHVHTINGVAVEDKHALRAVAVHPVKKGDAVKLSIDVAGTFSCFYIPPAKIVAPYEYAWLYPNGGTAAAPAKVAKASRYVMNSPWPGYKVKCTVQLQIGGKWGDLDIAPYFRDNTDTYTASGLTARQLDNSIVLQTSDLDWAVMWSKVEGNPFGVTALDASKYYYTAVPCRIYCEKGGLLP